MILEIDAGNSRIKWRVIDASGGKPLAAGVAADEQELAAQVAPDVALTAARLGCVRGEAAIEQLQAWVASQWPCSLQVARVERECAGVRNHYKDLSRLGVDRWLAMIAAYNRKQTACVIVDAGTALTIDALDAHGNHLGGYILPGRRLMTRAIEENTRIRLQSVPEPTIEPGHGTEAAVCNAVYASQVALIEKVLRDCADEQVNPQLFLAGGDAPVLASLLAGAAQDTEIVADLVLDGLRFACPEEGA